MACACLFVSFFSHAQTRTVAGTVLSASDNSPVAGASVIISGTKTGTATDIDGNFSIPVKAGEGVSLEFSSIGFKNLSAEARDGMKVFLVPDETLLDDVIVVAYGTAKKSSYAGSAVRVGGEQLQGPSNVNFESALSGKVSGLQITSSTGQPGNMPNLRIRGIGSMNASNEPLYIIDDVPVTSGNGGQMSSRLYTTNSLLNSLNPEDIESISVLKDAAASSLYGSRAANGVIIITTKRGSGKPLVTLNASVGFTPSWATDNYETASVQENVNMLYSVFHDYQTQSKGASDDVASAYALKQLNRRFNRHGYQFSTQGSGKYENVIISEYDNSGRGGKYFDWDDAYFRTAVSQNYDLSVSGSTPTASYYTSLGYTSEQGRLKINSFERISARVNVNQKVGKAVELFTRASYAKSTKKGYNDSRNTGANLFMQTRNLLWGLYWPTDYSTGEDWTARYGSYAQNNIYYNKEWDNSSKTSSSSISETFTIHLLPGLDLKSVLSYDNNTVRESIYYSAKHFNGSATKGSIDEMRTIYEKTVSSTTGNFTRSFGSHSIGLMAGFEAEKNKTDFTRSSGENLAISTLHSVASAGSYSANAYSWGNSLLSLISKADYNWKEKYFASASYRRDGSSRLSPDTRWGGFWSFAGAWRLSQETFMKEQDVVSNLRLRASYGKNGTLPSDNYGYMNLISYVSPYMGEPGGRITTLGNSGVKWETSYSSNIGLDFGLFTDALSGSVEYFNRDSRDLLQDVPISLATGFSTTLENIGEINNHGLEIELNGTLMNRKNLTWTASFNTSFLKSSVTKLYNGADIIWEDPTGGDGRAQFIYREGESTLAFYGYEWAGVDKTNGKSVYFVNDPKDREAGDFIYKGRGATYDYRKANYTVIGDATPWASGGFGTQLNFMGFDFTANFIYKLGGKLYDGAYKDVADDGYYWERMRAKSYYKNMWTPTHTDGTEPALSGLDLTDAMQYSSRHLKSATFLRLKSVILGYTLPSTLTQKMLISKARLWFSGGNLLTLSKYKEADPEVNQYGTRGWETPIGKSYVFGIDINF